MAITRRSVLLWVALAMVVVMSAASAVTGSRRVLLGALDIIPASMASNPPDVFLNFSTNQAQRKTSVTSASSLLTVSRASSGTVNDSNGNWTSVASNLPRLSNRGLLVEEARTNAIRNNSMAGAVVMADGVELTTNGTFTPAGGAGWTAVLGGGGSFNFSVAGQVTVSGTAANNSTYIYQQITGLVVGRNYVLKLTGPNSGNFFVGTTPGGVDVLNFSNVIGNGAGSNVGDRVGFTATATTLYVSLSGGSAATKTWTSVSLQDGERVENGGFTSNPINAAQSTVQNGWQWTNSAGTGSVVLSGNTVQIAGDGTHGIAFSTMALPTVAGFTYTITADITVTTCNVQAGTTAFAGGLLSMSSGLGAGQKFQFTATTSTTFITFAKTSASAATIANVSVQSAGALPTNWNDAGGTDTALLRYIVRTGTTNGVNTIDVQWVGTTNATARRLNFDNSTAVTAAYGQTWTHSFFAAVVGGSLTNITGVYNLIEENQSGGTNIDEVASEFSASLSAALFRSTQSRTVAPSNAGALQPRFGFNLTNGTAVNVTFRIGWPQLENNSLINSTVASAATAASGASGVNGSAVYSVGGGTGTAATLNVTWAAGVMTVNSVASAGSYTVFPPSPAALTYVSGTATGWTGATVNLTPTNNAASAFATSPIVTTSSAATRAADNVTLTSPPAFGSAYSMFAQATPQAGNGVNQFLLEFTDGTSTNRFAIFRSGSTGGADIVNTTGGSGLSTAGANWAQNTTGKYAAASQASDQAGAFNGGAVSTLSLGLPVGVNAVDIGNHINTGPWNGFISQSAIWASQRVPNAQLQSMTQ